jgi:hypothetical protein
MDKKQNPSLYPEWLSFLIPESVVDIRGGTIRITPVIDLYCSRYKRRYNQNNTCYRFI